MRKVSVAQLRPAMALGTPLHDKKGRVLLAPGVALTGRFISAIEARGYSSVYVQDGLADDVPPPELLSERVRVTTTSHLDALFSVTAAAAKESMPQRPSDWPAGTWPIIEAMYRDVDAIMGEVFAAGTLGGMTLLKSHDTYTFEHSIDTAVVSVMLGKRLGLHPQDLRQLGMGCLVHDIGKTFTALEVLNKAGPLTAPERDHIQLHPLDGYRLVASMGLDSNVPRHVAWQHHEKQDGSGYPRGLSGTNQVVRTLYDLTNQGRMMLLAEIAAVADVYSALSSDRPYRATLPPDQVAGIMRGMGGSHLNQGVLDAFFHVVPAYPAGLRVRLSGGGFDGWRGVVASVRPSHLHRPVVRLLQDPHGRGVTPDEIDLRRLPDVTLASEPLD